MKKLIDIFVPDEHDKPILVSAITFQESAVWATVQNCVYIDERLLQCYKDKPISRAFQSMDKYDILVMIGNFLQSKEYELNGLWQSTQLSYDPIENYNMTEQSSDEDYAASSGTSTDNTTTYDSGSDHKTGMTSSSANSSNTNTHSLTRAGNIGVTTSQQMIMQERGVLTFDFIQHVADLVNDNFCSAFWVPTDWEGLR